MVKEVELIVPQPSTIERPFQVGVDLVRVKAESAITEYQSVFALELWLGSINKVRQYEYCVEDQAEQQCPQ